VKDLDGNLFGWTASEGPGGLMMLAGQTRPFAGLAKKEGGPPRHHVACDPSAEDDRDRGRRRGRRDRGSLDVTGAVGRGTTVAITIPASQSAATQVA
jgi:hypothetical protein